MRKLLSIVALFVMTLLSVSLVSAVSVGDTVSISKVKVNGQEATVYTPAEVENTASINGLDGVAVDEGERLDVEVVLEAAQSTRDVQVEVELRGYEYSDYEDLSDRTHLFDINVDGTGSTGTIGSTTRTKQLQINLPNQLDKDRYFLRIAVDDKDSGSLNRYVVLQVDPSRHGVEIADVAFSPGLTVKAGRALMVDVLLQNFGDKDEKDVRVDVSIPALGVSDHETVDILATDNHNVDYEDVEEMFVQIPPAAQAGEYEVVVSVRYDGLRETVTKTYTVNVVENEMFQTSERLRIAVGPETQTIAQGKTATYALALVNEGQSSKAFLLEATAGDWATTRLSDNLVVLEPGKNKVVYVEVTATNDAAAGAHAASVAIKSGSETLEVVTFNANVVAGAQQDTGASFSLRNGLEIALIVLVVLLVIVGLIIGFSRLRKDNEEGEDQNYY